MFGVIAKNWSISECLTARTFLRKLSFFLILGLCTVLASCFVDKYTQTGEQLLLNPDFANDLDGWQVSGAKSAFVEVDSGTLKIALHEAESSVQLSQQLDPAVFGNTIVLKGRVKPVGITGGVKGWERGRIVLVQHVDGKAIYSSPHELVVLDGTHDWAEYSRVIQILPKTSEVKLSIQLSHCSGELLVKELSLYRVQANPLYGVVRWLVFGMWAVFMICVFIPGAVGSFEGRKWSAPVVLVIIAIVVGTTAPAALKNEAASEIISHAKAYSNQLIDYGGTDVAGLAADLKTLTWLRIDITKVGHFLLFGLLGGILYFRQGERPVLYVCIDIAMLAWGSELMQLFIDGRSALVGDVLIDFGGAGFCVLGVRCLNVRG